MPPGASPGVAPIAIVGMSCRLPGGANSIDELWDLVVNNGQAWSPVPSERFNEDAFHHPSPDNGTGLNHHPGGHFITDDLRDFDHAFFRLSSQQAAAMDPQQRLLLELTYEAIENAGLDVRKLSGTKTSVHVATFTADYERNLYKDPIDMPAYYMTGTETAIMSNRISHAFDLRGSSMTLDTACSGGLVSLHQACLGLLNGESDAAIVAAANVTLSPDHYIGMSSLHLIGSTGRSYPFDHRGDGYGRGEGCAVLVLKRLEDALLCQDPIHAVVRGTAVNQNGYNARGITNPSGDAQIELARAAYRRAGLNPRDVGYVEAHGTGTVAGDQEELRAIAEVFTGMDRSSPLYVGSIKGNIGHTENTSGLAAILQAALILNKKTIPPVAGFDRPKPGLPLDRFHIPTKPTPFPQYNSVIPRVSVNNFGFGGTNAHAILEQAPVTKSHTLLENSSSLLPKLFIFSANSQPSLKRMLEAYHTYLQDHQATDLCSLSYTLCRRRTALPWRFSCVAHDRDSLQANLKSSHLSIQKFVPNSGSRNKIFVFTGQGAQWVGMGRELLSGDTSPSVFRDSIRVSRDILFNLGASWNLEEELLCTDASASARFGSASFAQPATTALQIALITLLRAQDIKPDTVVGHSSGEIAAAFAAGFLTHRTALAIASYRGSIPMLCKKRRLPRGGMMAVALGPEKVAPLLEALTDGTAVIACINGPKSVTVSGDLTAIEELSSRLNAEGNVTFRRLFVDTAYHSKHMQTVQVDYLRLIETLDYTANESEKVPFVSSVTGKLKTSGFDSSYWVSNLVSPVLFSDAVQTIGRQYLSSSSKPRAAVIEVGPHPALAGPFQQSLEGMGLQIPKIDYTSVLRRKSDAVASSLELIGHLFQWGIKLEFDKVFDYAPGLGPSFSNATVLTNLPTYAWDHSVKHWHESRLSSEYRHRREPYHDLLGVRIVDSISIEPRWRYMVDVGNLPWLADHIVDDLVIFPGSGYLCMALEALLQINREWHPRSSFDTFVLRDVSFLRALVIPQSSKRTEMQLCLRQNRNQAAFTFSITALSDNKWHEHCCGTIERVPADRHERIIVNGVHATISDYLSHHDNIILDKDEIYEDLKATGNQYGATFRGCTRLEMSPDASRSVARVEIPDIQSVMPAKCLREHLIHPSTLDIVLHTGLPMTKKLLGAGSVMPVAIEELSICTNGLLPRAPGDVLEVTADLVSSYFRTANVKYQVSTTSNVPVLSISGLEMRSMAGTNNEIGNATQLESICYDLDWKMDIDFMRSRDLSPKLTLLDLIRHVCFKHADVSIAELGICDERITSAILEILDTENVTLSAYYCAKSVTSEKSSKTDVYQPRHPRVQQVELNLDTGLVKEGIEAGSCDVVFVSSIGDLQQASTIAKGDGTIILLLEENQYDIEVLRTAVRQATGINLELRFVIPESTTNKLVAVLRNNGVQPDTCVQKDICVFTHTLSHMNLPWIGCLLKELAILGFSVSIESMNSEKVNMQCADRFILIDDSLNPFSSSPACFNFVKSLVQRPVRGLWICPDLPDQMHQNIGFVRTAHAENSQLQLVTIHSALNILEDATEAQRLVEITTACLRRFEMSDHETQPEREYRITSDGVIMVPRLRSNKKLNEIVSDVTTENFSQVEMSRFSDNSRSLVLSPDSMSSGRKINVFIEDENAARSDLADDEIEIQTRAIRLNSDYRTSTGVIVGGVVSNIGTAVHNIMPHDRVVAIGPPSGANQTHIHQDHIIQLPSNNDIVKAAGLLPSVLAACYALHELARLRPSARVLVCGALTMTGRAVVAVAQSIGSRVVVFAEDHAKSQEIMDRLNIEADQVVLSQPHLRSSGAGHKLRGGLDVIVQTTDQAVPSELMGQLKSFGNVIFVGSTSQSAGLPKALRNVTMSFCEVEEILQLDAEVLADLITKARPVLQSISTKGVEVLTRDVAQVGEALQLLDTGVHPAVILTAEDDSFAPTLTPSLKEADFWENCDGSIVIAGGLGDIGRRLMQLMARRGARHFISLSRRVTRDEDREGFLRQLESIRPGCQLYCFECDISAESVVKDVAATIANLGLPPILGVIQSTVVLHDRTLDSMTFEDYRVPTSAKIAGTLLLKKWFVTPETRFFLMLSSAATIVGTSGQGNYNAGNTVQDAISQTYSEADCQFMTLSIGWIEDAVHTIDHKARMQGLSRAGLRSIRSSELSKYLDHALVAAMNKKRIPHTIIGFDRDSLSQAASANANSNIHSAMFRHVYSEKKTTTSATTTETLSFDQLASNGDREALNEFVANSIVTRLTQVLSTDATRIHRESGSILDLGLDSLIAIEIRNWIMTTFDAPVQSSEILQDQTIRSLAERVLERSRKVPANTNGHVVGYTAEAQPLASQVDEKPNGTHANLPLMPLPNIQSTLKQMQESRRAVDSEAEQQALADAIANFLQKHAPEVQKRLVNAGPDKIADNYDRQVHLERRGPVQDSGLFTLIHPAEAPAHTQAMRAAVLTVAGLQFARDLASGSLDADTARALKARSNLSDWTFYATRLPGTDIDTNVRFSPNESVAVLSRGHIFQLKIENPSMPLSVSGMHDSFLQILEVQDRIEPRLGILTADERSSWASFRKSLESNPSNTEILSCLDKCAFIVCLDEESPLDPGQRFTQFLLNGHRPFSNRWLDKPVQFAVTANGLSAGIYEHSKVDGLDGRLVHRQVVKALMSSSSNLSPSGQVNGHAKTESIPSAYSVRELHWSYDNDVKERIRHLETSFSSPTSEYGPMEHKLVTVPGLGRSFMRSRGAIPNSTAHVCIILALFLVDGAFRPAWEPVSLAGFARGRRDYIQTLTPTMRHFVEMTATLMAKNDDLGLHDETTLSKARSLLREAATTHSKMVAVASQGGGFVNHLYAIRGVLTDTGEDPKDLPTLFDTSAWHATKWIGPGQDLKIGFEPWEEDENVDTTGRGVHRWREAGFLLHGERGILVQCDVSKHDTDFNVSARPGYADLVCNALERAAGVIGHLLGGQEGNIDQT
ncbi:polyketide synthase [Xylariaceae sp. FL1272]|nr:polyketide synthase [Xylariaceae sp. FL1272]